MKNLFLYFATGVILLAVALMVWGLYQLTYPFKVMEFTKPEFPVQNKVVSPGELVYFDVDYCKYKDIDARINYELFDGTIFPSPEWKVSNIETGCGMKTNTYMIPHIVLDGEFRIMMIVEYEISPLRTVTVTGKTEPFTIKSLK